MLLDLFNLPSMKKIMTKLNELIAKDEQLAAAVAALKAAQDDANSKLAGIIDFLKELRDQIKDIQNLDAVLTPIVESIDEQIAQVASETADIQADSAALETAVEDLKSPPDPEVSPDEPPEEGTGID